MPGYIDIHQRRYLGNKAKLVNKIKKIIDCACPNAKTFFDVFSGTGVVAAAFAPSMTVITNDILYANYVSNFAWLSPQSYSQSKIKHLIDKFNSFELEEENYMSRTFGDTYFSRKTCKKIGFIREQIEYLCSRKLVNRKEKAILITALIYAMDRIANTVGHYDAYRKNGNRNGELFLKIPRKIKGLSRKNKCYCTDSNRLVHRIKADIAFLDPPYNSRQYADNYHLLENVARWNKPEVYGIARKMDRSNIKSKYNTKKATKAFEDLVKNIHAHYIVLTYNNTGNKAHERSNAKISDEDIMRVLNKKGEVLVYSHSHRAFSAGLSQNDENVERIFLCKVADRDG